MYLDVVCKYIIY